MNDLEQQFFSTFGIEPYFDRMLCDNDYQCNGECNTCKHQEDDNRHKFYPQITDRILLELICILNSVSVELKSECIEDLKREVLGETTILFEYAPNEETGNFIKHQVQALFEEG